MVDATSKKVRGKVNIRRNEKRETSRLRFTSVHDDQLEVILTALNKARAEAGTDYDVVALNCICMQYLASG